MESKPLPEHQQAPAEKIKPANWPRVNTPRVKPVCDPRLIAAARELRDRWLERINDADATRLIENATYDVTRALAIGAATWSPVITVEREDRRAAHAGRGVNGS